MIAKGLAKVIRVKEGTLPKVNFDLHAKNVEAILINPAWKQDGSAGISLEDFAHFEFSKHLLIDGLVFVWVEKEIIFDIIRILEKQDLIYVENVCWVMLDRTKRAGKWPPKLTCAEIDQRKTIDVSPAYIRDNYTYIKKSHKTLLIFRRLLKKSQNSLELRH